MPAIVFTPEQRATLEALTSNATSDFYAGYDYLKQELQALTSVDLASMQVEQQQVDGCIYWLTRASAINQNVLSDAANNFVRDVTRYGLLWDGKPVGHIQSNSDSIGRAVILEAITLGTFLPIDDIAGSDVQAAIDDSGQTIGGWGGAFYYWNSPYEAGGTDATVGSAISADASQLEKFIALASCATFNALSKTFADPFNLANAGSVVSDLLTMLLTGFSAGVPPSVKWEIGDRVTDFLAGTRSHFSDNPLFWGWEKSLDLSNAAGNAQTGQNGFDINLITGVVEGIHHSDEDFQTFFDIENLRGSNLGDRITLDGTISYIEVQAGSGDDRVYATGGTVVAHGGGGDDTFVVNAAFQDVAVVRTFDRLTFNGVNSGFTYLLADFDTIQFSDQSKSFLDLLNSTVQEFTGSGDLVGTQWNDRLIGGTGRTVIAGLAGADEISDNDWLVLDYSASDAGVTIGPRDIGGVLLSGQMIGVGGHAQGDIIVLDRNARLDIIGSQYADVLYGTSAGSWSFGHMINGDNEIRGGGGNDIINGGSGTNWLYGDDGDDTIYGSSGTDYIYGGTGYDIISAGGGTNYVDFGTGGGELKLPDSAQAYYANMETREFRYLNGQAGTTTTVVGDFDKLTGTNYADEIHGSSGNDRIYGGGGFDTIHGGAGNDYIEGYGNLYGGADNDTIKLLGTDAYWKQAAWGEAGNDVMTTSAKQSTLHGGSGQDTLTSTTYRAKLIGGEGGDIFKDPGAYNAWNWISYEDAASGIGVDYNGSTGTGWLGDAAGDTMTGNFSFYGSEHADTFNIKLNVGYGTEIRGGAGSDVINAVIGPSTTVYGDGLTEIAGATYDDIITTTGTGGIVYGGRGDDIITGVGRLYGDSGADRIKGVQGDQTFYLGVDTDIDTFVFSRLPGYHRVNDFTSIDVVEIGGGYKYDSFSDIMDNATQVGNNVEIVFETNSKIILANYNLANLSADNFSFA